jgi:hypothetical protein
VQATQTLGSFVAKVGLRVEHTDMSGRQLFPADTSFRINRWDAFPYLYFYRTLLKIAGYPLKGYLVYRRTITRPGYELLNPFARYIDPYLSETGNPALRPQFTKNYEFNISVDETPLLAVGLNETQDIFTSVMYQADSNQTVAYRTYDNLGKNKETYFRLLGAIPPGGKYFFVLGAQYNHNLYNGQYENKPLQFKRGSWLFFTFHTLKLGSRSVATLNAFARLNGQQQFYELDNFGGVACSINRQFFKKKLTVTLNMSDLFFTNNNHFYLAQGTVRANGYRETDTRRFGVNVRYNFGWHKKEETPANNPPEGAER